MTFDDEEVMRALADNPTVNMQAETIHGDAKDPMDKVLALADATPRTAAAPTPAPVPPAPASNDSGGGLDWARGLWAAGGGDLGAFDAERARRAELPFKRQVQQEELAAKQETRQLARAAMDPLSSISKQRQLEYATQMQARAQIAQQSGMNELARTFADEAKRAATMSATQIDRASGTFGGVLKESLSAADMLAKQELSKQNTDLRQRSTLAQEDMAKQGMGLRWADFNARKEERDLRREERQDARDDKKAAAEQKRNDALPPGAQADEHIMATETLSDLKRAQELLPKVSYIGTGAKTINTILSGAPEALDLRTPEDREFATLVQRIAAPERHKFFGSALSKGEDLVSQELLPGIGKNKATVDIVLKKMGQNLEGRLGKQRKLYPGLNKVTEFSGAATGTRPAGTRATNPKTGEVIEWDGNQWQKVQ